MPTQFLYQPHIHGDGMVLTPDFPIARVLAFSGEGGPHPLSPKRLVTDQVVQNAAEKPQVLAAYALVAASEGPLVVAAAFIVEPFGDQSSIAAGDVALSRQAVRLKDCDPSALCPALDDGTAAPVLAASRAIEESEGLPYGTLVLCAAEEGPPARTGPVTVTLPTGAKTLTHPFQLERLW
ncbi:MAG: hypothetical protein AAF318_03775 [Pseudomonadota bacterium]